MFDLLDGLIRDGLDLQIQLWKQPGGPVHLELRDGERTNSLSPHSFAGSWEQVKAKAPEQIRVYLEYKLQAQALADDLAADLQYHLDHAAEPDSIEEIQVNLPDLPVIEARPLVPEPETPPLPPVLPIAVPPEIASSPWAVSVLTALQQKPKSEKDDFLRWVNSKELSEAVAKLPQRLPEAIGEWDGTPQELDPQQVDYARVDGYALKRK